MFLPTPPGRESAIGASPAQGTRAGAGENPRPNATPYRRRLPKRAASNASAPAKGSGTTAPAEVAVAP